MWSPAVMNYLKSSNRGSIYVFHILLLVGRVLAAYNGFIYGGRLGTKLVYIPIHCGVTCKKCREIAGPDDV